MVTTQFKKFWWSITCVLKPLMKEQILCWFLWSWEVAERVARTEFTFSWAELVMVSISATPCTSNSSRATWCCETTTVQIPTLTQNKTELCVRWQVWKMSCNFRHGQAVYSDLLPLLFLLHEWTRSKNLLSKRSV